MERTAVCLIVDGAWDALTYAAGLGWVFCNWRSLSVFRGGARACRASSALQAEFMACYVGLKKALAAGFRVLLVYTDSADLVRILKRQFKTPVSVWWVAGEIGRLMNQFQSIGFFKVDQAMVSSAHTLAGRARRRELFCHSFVC